jgi:hypothetical protein
VVGLGKRGHQLPFSPSKFEATEAEKALILTLDSLSFCPFPPRYVLTLLSPHSLSLKVE